MNKVPHKNLSSSNLILGLRSKATLFDEMINTARKSKLIFFEAILIKNLILFLSGSERTSIFNLTGHLFLAEYKKIYLDIYLLLLKKITEEKPQEQKNLKPNLIFGLGTGRSGSTSLYDLFKIQNNTFSSHEHPPLVSWKSGFDNVKFHIERSKILQKSFANVVDVSHWWLPYVEDILNVYPNAKFVCMKREKNDTVNSFLNVKKCNEKNGVNHWMEHDGKFWHPTPWDMTYPTYNVKTVSEAIENYWDDYYQTCESFKEKFPNQFRIFEISNLSTIEGQLEILNFCDFSEPILEKEIKKNVGSAIDGFIGWSDLEKLFSKSS